MIKEDEVYKIGQLGKPHGYRGEITFSFTTDVWDRVDAEYLILMIDGILVPFFLDEYRFRGEHSALLRFEGRDSAEALQDIVGAEVYFPYSLTPNDDEGEYTWKYFEGFRVIDDEAGDLGTISRVDDTTVNTIFELRAGVLIPAVEEFISEIDHQGRTIRTHLPEGLLEL